VAEQDLTSDRTGAQRRRSRAGSIEPGKPGRGIVILLYALLGFLVIVDYVILLQAFTLISAAQSTGSNSVASQFAFIVLAVSLAAVMLPHLAAWGLHRRSLGILLRPLRWVPWAAIALWVTLVSLVTYLRLVAANTTVPAKVDNTVDVGAPNVPATVAPAVDPGPLLDFSDPAVILTFFMLLLLIISAIMAYVISMVVHSPVRTARKKSSLLLAVAEEDATERTLEHTAALESLELAREADTRDRERFDATVAQMRSKADGVRAEVRAIMAAALGDPEATSTLLRDFQARYPRA
jgi:hypothetical protein